MPDLGEKTQNIYTPVYSVSKTSTSCNETVDKTEADIML